ncbi:hypothetical protein [Flavobacterium sp. GSP14]|uniref:hypothetical protein n=1 Tax=Flavobacterium sp. GSP14 TaxID=3401734 RepID=UPI003AAE9616
MAQSWNQNVLQINNDHTMNASLIIAGTNPRQDGFYIDVASTSWYGKRWFFTKSAYKYEDPSWISINTDETIPSTLNNVGIGINNPTSKLHVNGNLRVENGVSVGGGDLFNIDAVGLVGGRMTVLPGSGNVGLGKINPTAKLEINGDTRMTSQLRFKNAANSLSNAKGIVWGDINYGGNFSRIDDDGNLRILTDDEFYLGKLNADGSNGTFTLYADVNAGNVGIGIVKNLGGRLHLYEPTGTSLSATAGTLVLEHGDSGGQSSILFKSAVNKNNDSGYIKFSDDGSGNGSTNENGLLEIGVGNDASNNIHTDDIALMPSGNVGIGTRKPSTTLSVNGTVTALNYAVVVYMAADYVFEADYKLKTLAETEAYIKENKHLPAFKSAKHYEKEGYTITEMNIALQQTVEELTLHAIAQEKEINTMKSELAAIKSMLLAKK